MSDPVIIVGSGPAGVSAAWPLLQAGIPVLMIDAALPGALPTPPTGDIAGFRGRPDRWVAQFGANFSSFGGAGDRSPKLSTPLANAVLAGFAEATGLDTANFLALGSLSAGGLSNIWGAAAVVYDDEELRGYPFSRADLLPSYAAVMSRIGVSGPDNERSLAGETGLAIPEGPKLTPPLRRVWDAAQRSTGVAGFELTRATNAVLAEARDGRGPCVNCGLCLWGCHHGSIYNSASELPALRAFPHFTYRPGMRARSLPPFEGTPSIDVEFENVRMTLTGQRIVLACGTIATTALVLRALGASAGSPRLLTNPVAALAFIVPSLFGVAPPALSFALGQLAYRATLPDGDRAAGLLYGADALPLATFADRLPLSRPAALRLSRALTPALVVATCYLPSRFSSNTISLTGGEDTPLIVEGNQSAESDQALRDAGRHLSRTMRRLGAYSLPGSFAVAPPGADAHYAGTLPMGGKGHTATDLSGALKSLPGVHIVDGAVLPYLPARHCTLTIMANADRIARRLLLDGQVMR